ncbi:hypothetical protein LTS08_002687 [Lithohypha guttulata]|uniref:FAS1 domain-containing protein n=1 Tax=Lithohypha guttulata TaxID=1690604 RepID=A0AAN7T645_9EURO|nr:hypothetical protein LTR05_000584 [Lithohypha guttulata]KAK5104794.1 hypothetical protein LTS08_002687 [Lithohypha guttulata]
MKYAGLVLAVASTAFGQSLIEVLGGRPELSQLTGLLNSSGLAGDLSSLTNNTLLAPNNAAIGAFLNSSTGAAVATDSALVQAILQYHVLQGNYSTVNATAFIPTLLVPPQYTNVTTGQVVQANATGSNVTFFSGLSSNSSVVNASIPFSGGTIHIINRFLTVPQNISTTGVALNLTSAVGAIGQLNLTQAVDYTPDLTVFLPNNAAFQRIGGNLANLTVEQLAGIFAYHIVNGTVLYSTDIQNGTSVETTGGNVTLTLQGSNVFVNNARVIRPNVLVANGVVHVIDRVLNPANTTATPNASTTEEAFPGATSASNEPFTSGVPTPTSAVPTTSAAGGSSSSSGGAWRPIETGAIGMVALFGGAAVVMNI